MSERRDTMHRATLAGRRDRAERLRLLRPGTRVLWHERTQPGLSHVVVRRSGDEEQRGASRPTAALGAPRLGGPVRLDVHVVADALEAAYADRCRTREAGAEPGPVPAR